MTTHRSNMSQSAYFSRCQLGEFFYPYDTTLSDGLNLLTTCLHSCLPLHHSWPRPLLGLHIIPAPFRHKLSTKRGFFHLRPVLRSQRTFTFFFLTPKYTHTDKFVRLDRLSQHYYSGSFCLGSSGVLQDLMTKATIRSNLSAFSPDIAATVEKKLDYVLGETNSYACHVSESLKKYCIVLIMLFVSGRELLVSAIRREQPCGRWIISCSRMWLSCVVFSLSSYSIPNIDRHLAFRKSFSMKELASNIIWYVHIGRFAWIYIRLISSLNFLDSACHFDPLNARWISSFHSPSSSHSAAVLRCNHRIGSYRKKRQNTSNRA